MNDRELDARIAREFLGWHTEIVAGDPIWFKPDDSFIAHENFKPTSDPASCSLVLNEIERRGWFWEWSHKWDSHFMVVYDLNGTTDKPVRVHGKAWHDNRYRAICEAALQAAEGERK